MKYQPAQLLLLLTTILVSACTMGPTAAPRTPSGVAPAGTTNPIRSTPVANRSTPEQPSGSVSASPKTKPVTITFGASEPARQFYEPLITAFTTDNPDIHVEFVALDTFGDEGSTVRGIVHLVDTAEAYVFPEDRVQGYMRDLTPFIDADPTFDRADYYPGALSEFARYGNITVLPQFVEVPLLAYNKSMWLARGIPEPTPDWTWMDVIEAAEKVTQRQGDITEVYGLLDWRQGFPHLLAAELDARGVDLLSLPLAQIQLTHPDTIAAIQHLVERIQAGVILLPEMHIVHLSNMEDDELTFDEIQQMARAQHLGIWPADALDLDVDETMLPFEVAIVPAPMTPRFVAGWSGYIMSNGTQHPEAAWRWLSFLSHQLDYERDNDISFVPARRSLAELSGYWSNVNAPRAEVIRTAIEQPLSEVFTLDPALAEALTLSWFTMISGYQPVEVGLAESQERLEQLLAETSHVTTAANPAPVIVAPPANEQTTTNTVIFDATALDAGVIEQIAQAFTLEHPEIMLGIRQVADPERDPDDMTPISWADCFAWPARTMPGEITRTLDLRPLIDADVSFTLNDYPKMVLAPFERGTGLYGLPHTVSFRVLNYNQALFTASGLQPPDADWSLVDLEYAAQQLTSTSRHKEQYGYAQRVAHPEDLFFFLQQFDAVIAQEQAGSLQLDFTNERVLTALEYYIDLRRNYSPDRELTGYKAVTTSDSTSAHIRNGTIGMWFDFGIQPGFFAPDYQKQLVPAFSPAIAPPPFQNGTVTLQDLRVQGLYISANTPHPEACWQWMKYLTEEVSSMGGQFPARVSVARSEAFTSQAPAGAMEVYNFYQKTLKQTPARSEMVLPPDFNYYWFYQAVDQALQGADLEQELSAAELLTEQYIVCIDGGESYNDCVRQVDPDYQGFLE